MKLIDFNPFDTWRHVDENGCDYWIQQEIAHLLDLRTLAPELADWQHEKYSVKFSKDYISSQDLGFMLLELATFFGMTSTYGLAVDGLYVHKLALSIYKGQSASATFHSSASLLENKIISFDMEQYMYAYIDKNWKLMFPFASDIEKQAKLKGCGTADYLLDGIYPVEVKKIRADASAFKQLKKYIDHLKAPYGFVVAEDVEIKPPSYAKACRLTRKEVQEFLLGSHVHIKQRWKAISHYANR